MNIRSQKISQSLPNIIQEFCILGVLTREFQKIPSSKRRFEKVLNEIFLQSYEDLARVRLARGPVLLRFIRNQRCPACDFRRLVHHLCPSPNPARF